MASPILSRFNVPICKTANRRYLCARAEIGTVDCFPLLRIYFTGVKGPGVIYVGLKIYPIAVPVTIEEKAEVYTSVLTLQ